MKDHAAEARKLFSEGFQCSQAVLAVFSEECGFDTGTALKMASPFGGGMGGFGKTCGALTGAMMVVGLKYGTSDLSDPEARQVVREKTRALIGYFEKIHGSSQCNDLIGFDRSNLSGAGLAAKIPHFHEICPCFLDTVVTWLEEEL